MNVGQLKAELTQLPEHLEVHINVEDAPYWVELYDGGIYPCTDRVQLDSIRFEGSFILLEPK